MPEDPMAILSADIEPKLAQANAATLVPHATLAFKSPSPKPAWTESSFFDGRLAYLVCTEDLAIPKVGQEAMMQGTGQKWAVREMKGSHNSPFLGRPRKAVEIVEGFVQIFLRVQG